MEFFNNIDPLRSVASGWYGVQRLVTSAPRCRLTSAIVATFQHR